MAEETKLYEGTLDYKNPWEAQDGEQVYKILLVYKPAGAASYVAPFVVPLSVAHYHSDELEGAATQAFLWAKEHDGLHAPLMAYCSFFYRESDAEGWVYFL
jgi:hypothetical protein